MSDLAERLGADAQRGMVLSYIKGNTVASIGILLVLVLAVLALAGPWLVPHDPLDQSFLSAGQGPSPEYWFGTDAFGRDVFSRVLLGTQASLAIGVTAPVLAALCGTWAGMLAGYFGGWTDRLLSRFSDLLMSFPSLLLGVMIAAALGPGFRTAIVAIAIALFPRFVRLARSATQVVRREPFIDASIAVGPRAIRDHGAARAAEHRRAADRGAQPMDRHRDPAGGRTVVPRSRHAAAGAKLGQHDPRGHGRSGRRSMAGGVRRSGDHRRGAGVQHGGRRVARPARPGAGCVTQPLLAVDDLRVHLFTSRGVVRAVDGVGFSLRAGGSLGIVGESGCGKTMTALALMRLIPSPPARIVSGRIMFDGEDVAALGEPRLRELRGDAMAMIYQDPMTTLNPVFTVGEQIAEAVRLHRDASRATALARAVEMLELVGIPDPSRRAQSYPHQLSGGMRQRAVIAMALACHPKLLIADEPTTALDVTIQAQILDLMRRLQQELGTAIILITHDLGVIADLVDQVVVMYAGKVVEHAPVKRLFAAPRHPYTQGLLRSVPSLDAREHRMRTIEGTVPSAFAMPQGCRFHPRCAIAREVCRTEEPPVVSDGAGGEAACWALV